MYCILRIDPQTKEQKVIDKVPSQDMACTAVVAHVLESDGYTYSYLLEEDLNHENTH